MVDIQIWIDFLLAGMTKKDTSKQGTSLVNYYQNDRYLIAILFLAFYLSLFNSLSELHFFFFIFIKG